MEMPVQPEPATQVPPQPSGSPQGLPPHWGEQAPPSPGPPLPPETVTFTVAEVTVCPASVAVATSVYGPFGRFTKVDQWPVGSAGVPPTCCPFALRVMFALALEVPVTWKAF